MMLRVERATKNGFAVNRIGDLTAVICKTGTVTYHRGPTISG